MRSWLAGVRRIGRRWAALPPGDRGLLFRALVTLVRVRLTRAMPVERLGVVEVGSSARASRAIPDPRRIAWAVRAAGRFLPGGQRCLVQSVAVQSMLRRSRLPGRVRIGFRRETDGRLRGHAWVESQGAVLTGGADPGSFVAVAAIDARTRV